MSNTRILIHIGYPKCASSWLQQVMFADKQTGFLAYWGAKSKIAKKQFVKPIDSSFDADTLRRTFKSGLQEATQQNLIPVLSHEHLSGDLMRKSWKKEVADRIHKTFPEARILVIIREQKSILLSAYGQCIKFGITPTIEEFFGTIPTDEKQENDSNSIFKLDFVKYDSLIEYYQNIFSKENVLILPFELLKKNQHNFAQTILDFGDSKGSLPEKQSPRNPGYGGGKLVVKRQLNFLVPRYNKIGMHVTGKLSAAADKIIPASLNERIENRWKHFIEQRVGDSFRQSNQRTSRLIGINLADFGYDC